MKRLREWARQLKHEVVALWFCTRHPRTPFMAKALAAALVAYAFSPIDLIPDFIPVLGYLDDLILLPIGIWLVLKLVPADVLAECRDQATRWLDEKNPEPRSRLAAVLIVTLWLAALIFVSWLAWRWAESWIAL
ncbi:MAG TPA: YkvA family protein [Burkholderiales bacterium]|nr:YkvA family protein [Burkholderiales bacterium]